tara:strand:- start:770 stop:952 length:183 start_codon:yes stop_codon:yes gene_type:complete
MLRDLKWNMTKRAINIMCHGDSKPCQKELVICDGYVVEHRCGAARKQGKKHAQFGTVVLE